MDRVTVTGSFQLRRLASMAAVVVTVCASMAWMAHHRAPHPGSPLAARLAALRGTWPAGRLLPTVAIIAALLALTVGGAVITAVRRRPTRRAAATPTPLGRIAVLTAAASALIAFGVYEEGLPLWGVAVISAIPVIPLAVLGVTLWRFHDYGSLLLLGVLTVLQLAHMGEHITQALQLLVYNGNADLAHGILTRLDQELVHVVWTSSVWLGTAVLVLRLPRNRWLWIALAVASLHEVEHLYLFTVYKFDLGASLHGGLNGIFSSGGLVGGPLQRPYTHFIYNALELLPLAAAFIDEAAAAWRSRQRGEVVQTGYARPTWIQG